MKLSDETVFFSGLIELQYGLDVSEKLKEIAKNIEWAKGWPENKKSFWNAEAFMWNHKIEKEKRFLIYEELGFLQGKKNLDLGCGSYSYLKSVGFDISEKMLQFNDNCVQKIVGDLEKKMPFSCSDFGSITVIFVLNYVKNYLQLFKEIKRILCDNGVFVMVLSSNKINKWQREKEENCFSAERWVSVLESFRFKVEFYEKEKLWFFKCLKGSEAVIK